MVLTTSSDQPPSRIVVILADSSTCNLLDEVPESKWRPVFRYPDWVYRVDPADPQRKIKRHVHISRKKHSKSKDKQVAWNDDGSRHDSSSFDDGMSGIEKARKIARDVLGVPNDTRLVQVWKGWLPAEEESKDSGLMLLLRELPKRR
jgi:hypothetical protein